MLSFLKAKENKTKELGTLTLEIWSLYVSDGFMGAIHGNYFEIKEAYVPALGVCINLAEGNMHMFFTDRKRYGEKDTFAGKRVPDPKLVEVKTLNGSEAETIRNLVEIHILREGIQKDAKGLIQEILKEKKEKEGSPE